eukprot:TRINITY_DN9292_c0_g1_i4.p2 TRINITY_DN9292_c0_g1~~TRINITY_DN9292_c0_g1_i4.p2  ORF type:complete len:303 (-),score=58.83 TRINITY_DN9292_c0_g1_i4:1228-2136(-)
MDRAVRECIYALQGYNTIILPLDHRPSTLDPCSPGVSAIRYDEVAFERMTGMAISSLEQYLDTIKTLASIVRNVDIFIDSFKVSSIVVSSLINCIENFITDYKMSIMDLCNSVENMVQLYVNIQDYVGKLLMVKELMEYIKSMSEQLENIQISCILDYLYELVGKSSGKEYDFSKELFYAALKPYLKCLEEWVVSGKIVDNNQFFIENLNTDNRYTTIEWVNNFKIAKYNGKYAVPVFLTDIVESILSAGKSINIMLKMNHKEFDVKSLLNEVGPMNLFHNFATYFDKSDDINQDKGMAIYF